MGKGEWNELRDWDLHIYTIDAMYKIYGLPRWLSGKESNAGDSGSIPESRRSSGVENGNPL